MAFSFFAPSCPKLKWCSLRSDEWVLMRESMASCSCLMRCSTCLLRSISSSNKLTVNLRSSLALNGRLGRRGVLVPSIQMWTSSTNLHVIQDFCVRRIQPLTVFLEMVHRLLVGFQEGNDALHHADQMVGIWPDKSRVSLPNGFGILVQFGEFSFHIWEFFIHPRDDVNITGLFVPESWVLAKGSLGFFMVEASQWSMSLHRTSNCRLMTWIALPSHLGPWSSFPFSSQRSPRVWCFQFMLKRFKALSTERGTGCSSPEVGLMHPWPHHVLVFYFGRCSD